MRIPDNTLEAIKERVDIVQVVGLHVQLKKAGRNHVGLCPFHGEKTPSFNVSPERRTWHCFGCGEGGNVFTFLTRLTGKPFPEVVKELAGTVGVEVEERQESPAEREANAWRDRLHAMLDRAWHFFVDALVGDDGAAARAYLAQRGMDDRAVAEFEIGYGGTARDGLWQTLGRTPKDQEELLKAGLCIAGDRGTYDRFGGRVVFPIRDDRQRVVGFGGRVFGPRAAREGVAKYVNTSESPVYDKSAALYRLPQAMARARKGAPVVVVEGYFDALALERCGLACVATCGTALTPAHGRLLQRIAGKGVVLCWDGDAAGDRAAQRAASVLLPLHVDARVAVLPPGDDPDTYVARMGQAGAERLVTEAEPLPGWVIAQAARAAEEVDDDVRHKVEIIRGMGWLFQALPPGLERDLYLEQAAQRLGVPPVRLARELKTASPQGTDPRSRTRADRPSAGHRPVRAENAPNTGEAALQPQARELFRLVLEHPEKAGVLEEHPLVAHLPALVRPFLAIVRQKVQEHGPFSPESPVFAALRTHIQHPDLLSMHADIVRGMRAYPDDAVADQAVAQLLDRLQLGVLKARRTTLLAEAQDAAGKGDEAAVARLHQHLREVTHSVRELEKAAAARQGMNA